jgi:hypothetical protein
MGSSGGSSGSDGGRWFRGRRLRDDRFGLGLDLGHGLRFGFGRCLQLG